MNTHELMMPIPETALNNIDGRVKLALTFSGLITAVAAKTWELPLFFGVASLLSLALVGTPINLVLKRLRPVLYVATLIGLTQIFFYGDSLWFQWNIGFVQLSGYYEGLDRGLFLAARVFGGMSVMLLLTMSTSLQEWVSALAWFKIPLTVIEVMTLAYSSLFVLLEELDRLQKAQRMRLGYGSGGRLSGQRVLSEEFCLYGFSIRVPVFGKRCFVVAITEKSKYLTNES